MKDISRRLSRYRLSRYGSHEDWFRRLRWLFVGVAVWVLWAGLLSDHSFYRLWRLEKEQQRTVETLERTRHAARELSTEITDPKMKRDRTEAQARKQGMARPGEIVYRISDSPVDSLKREP
jgi:cell division protein FtsB